MAIENRTHFLPPGTKFISSKQVCARYGGRSFMWLERKLKHDPKFPRPRRIGRLRFFELEALEGYERSLLVG